MYKGHHLAEIPCSGGAFYVSFERRLTPTRRSEWIRRNDGGKKSATRDRPSCHRYSTALYIKRRSIRLPATLRCLSTDPSAFGHASQRHRLQNDDKPRREIEELVCSGATARQKMWAAAGKKARPGTILPPIFHCPLH